MLEDNINIARIKINKALAKRTNKKNTGNNVTIVAVTKNHPATVVTEALVAGLQNIGENRVQEAKSKRELLGVGGIWHLIGHLQTNKVKQAVELFDLVESVDSAKVLAAINKEAGKIGKIQDVLLQVNVAGEVQKSGFSQEEFLAILPKLLAFDKVRIRGLMVIGQATENPEETRPIFALGYKNFLLLQNLLGAKYCDILSMGMTHDYWVAVEEGANSVRLGTALFGLRDYSIK